MWNAYSGTAIFSPASVLNYHPGKTLCHFFLRSRSNDIAHSSLVSRVASNSRYDTVARLQEGILLPRDLGVKQVKINIPLIYSTALTASGPHGREQFWQSAILQLLYLGPRRVAFRPPSSPRRTTMTTLLNGSFSKRNNQRD